MGLGACFLGAGADTKGPLTVTRQQGPCAPGVLPAGRYQMPFPEARHCRQAVWGHRSKNWGSCAAVWGGGEMNSPDSYPMAPRESKGKAYTGVRQWAAPSRGKMVHMDSGAVAGSWGPPAGRSCLDRVSQSAWLNLAGEKGPAHV